VVARIPRKANRRGLTAVDGADLARAGVPDQRVVNRAKRSTMILVVDDDDDIRELLASALESRGFAVEQASNGERAIAALSHERPCLVLLDLVMPGMDGWAVLEQMKAGAMPNVPVCVMSALPRRAPAGTVATLTKPFELKELISVAERYCRGDHAC
jgi:DNA-binding response OmpR family regulator